MHQYFAFLLRHSVLCLSITMLSGMPSNVTIFVVMSTGLSLDCFLVSTF